MAHYEYCSNCGKNNKRGHIDGNIRYFCSDCGAIHYENPKPTATLICPKDNFILLARRAVDPSKGEWGLPGGFMELNETLYEAACRELKEETNLQGNVSHILGTCSHYGSIYGDILLIGLEVHISNWNAMKPGDDVSELKLVNINNLPDLAFDCHRKIVSFYKDGQK